MNLLDSNIVIAATALVHDLRLLTRNVDDFQHIAGLTLSRNDAVGPPPSRRLTPSKRGAGADFPRLKMLTK